MAPGTFLPPEHDKLLTQAKPCCSSYREIKYQRLNLGEEIATALTPESPVFEFPHARSFFAAFELPSDSLAILVKTYPVNMLYNRTGHVLVPAVLFLDAGHNPIGILKPRYLPRKPKVIGDSWAEGEAAVPRSARYFILLDGKSSGGFSWGDSDQFSGFLFVRSGPTGEISVLAL
jgi:hypothetical protein